MLLNGLHQMWLSFKVPKDSLSGCGNEQESIFGLIVSKAVPHPATTQGHFAANQCLEPSTSFPFLCN